MAALRSALTGLLLWGLTFPLTEACGWNTTALTGTVQFPDFPGNHSNNQSCVYIITAPEGYQVTLNFTDLDIDPSTNCTDGFVEIRDGDNETSPLIGRYCNQTLPGRRRTFGNQMWIKFVSDGNATGQGFRATFVSAKLQAPYFLFAGEDIFRMDVDTNTYYAVPMKRSVGFATSVDFDPVEQTIYWLKGYGGAHIHASFINGSRARNISTTGSYVYCLAMDPLSRLIFYCHDSRAIISMVIMRTMATRTVINSSVSWRTDIKLNTVDGVMFWRQYSTHYTIERASYDGSDLKTVVNESIYIKALALDVSNKRLYWMTGYPYRLKMSDLEGKEQSIVFTFPDYYDRLILFNTTFYFTFNSGYRAARLFRWDIGSVNYTVAAELPFRVYGLCVVQPGLSSDIVCPENYWGTDCSQTCNCSERATCDVLEGCVCNRGWSGVTCSTDVNECETMTNACGQNQTCKNNPGSFVCHCPPAFLKVGDKCVEHTRFLDFGSQQGDSTLPKGRQRLSAKVSVPSGLPITGKIVTEAFVSMNGLISFGKKYDSFSAMSLPVSGFDLMCGFWTDLQLPTTDTTANVWYQVYRRNEKSTARDLSMLTMGGKKVELYANVSSYLPVFMLVATFQHVPLDGVFTDRTEKVTFQMSVVSDGFTTYGLVTYAANGMQVDRSLGRAITMGYLSTDMDIPSPDTDKGNTGLC